jgi:acyl-CoA thioester hydrolase
MHAHRVDPLGSAQAPWSEANPFVQQVQPQAADIDGLGHTNNAVYVRWCQAIAWAHSEALGLSVADYQRLDRAMVIQEAHYAYKQATFEGEDLLLATWLKSGNSALGMQRQFQLTRCSDQRVVLQAHWNLVCIEISSGKPKRLPTAFINAYVPSQTEHQANE